MLKRAKKKLVNGLYGKIEGKTEIESIKVCIEWCEKAAEDIKEQLNIKNVKNLDFEIVENELLYEKVRDSYGRPIVLKNEEKIYTIPIVSRDYVEEVEYKSVIKIDGARWVITRDVRQLSLSFSSEIDKNICSGITRTIKNLKEIKIDNNKYKVAKTYVLKTLNVEDISYRVGIFFFVECEDDYIDSLKDTLNGIGGRQWDTFLN